jgi:ankyrin repeat protein
VRKKGFLPLHWAVNQDAPNIEVVRKLIKIFPAGAGMPSLSGNLPLHYCVSRARLVFQLFICP